MVPKIGKSSSSNISTVFRNIKESVKNVERVCPNPGSRLGRKGEGNVVFC